MTKENIELLRGLSSQIDELYNSGKEEEGRELLAKAIEDAKKTNKAYACFFQGEWAGYEEKDFNKQGELFEEALAIRGDDSFLLRNMGVNQSILGREEEAIEWYDKALSENPKDWKAMRQRGVSLSILGRKEEAIEWYDKALSENSKDWNAMRNRGVSLSKLGREEEAIEWYDKALSENPKDWKAMRQRGVSLSILGREEEAIAWFDKALSEKPKDWNAMRDRGVSMSKLGREEEAIAWYDKALSENPKDWNAMRQRGVSLSILGREEEAMEWFKKALAIKTDDAKSYVWIAYVEYKRNNEAKAWAAVKHAYELDPSDVDIQRSRRFLAKQYRKKVEDDPFSGPGTQGQVQEQHQDLVALIRRVRKAVDKPNKLLKEMESNLKRFKDFLRQEPAFIQNRSLFMVLRKWNSYTPAIPTFGDDNIGGGYYLLHQGQGTVIDPGYDFIKNIANSGGRFSDIHNVIITHAHNDHTIDFESILTLAHTYNKKTESKQLKVYMNLGAYQKFSGLIDLRDMYYLDWVRILEPDAVYDFGNGLSLTVLPAYHDEIVSEKYAVGLCFDFISEQEKRVVMLTSDTGLHPWKKVKGGEDQIVLDDPIWKRYPARGKIDLLVPHIGSIKSKELGGDLTFLNKPDEVFYQNHLGILGVAVLLANLSPELVLVSEFGVELKTVQRTIIEVLQTVMDEYLEESGKKVPPILPADIPFMYDVWGRSIYCVSKKKFVDPNGVKFERNDQMKHFYYTSEKDDQKIKDKIQTQANNFDKSRRGRRVRGIFS